MSWDSEFAEPIDLPNNVVATTLRRVIAYIDELPDAEQNSREWQNARKRSLQAAVAADLCRFRARRNSGLRTRRLSCELG